MGYLPTTAQLSDYKAPITHLSDYKASKAESDQDNQLKAEPLVLIVEDEVLLRMSVSEDLRMNGFRVIEAHDADEAVEVLRARKDVDVVFSDIVMPGTMNGADLALTWLRQNKPTVPVLLTSGVAHGLLSLQGAGHVLPKPYNTDKLSAALRALISGQSGGFRTDLN